MRLYSEIGSFPFRRYFNSEHNGPKILVCRSFEIIRHTLYYSTSESLDIYFIQCIDQKLGKSRVFFFKVTVRYSL